VRRLGDTEVFDIGLGCMPLSHAGRPDAAQAARTIHAALDAGVTLIDTADAYALDEAEFGHNEELVARALRGRSRDGLIVATKGGHVRHGEEWGLDGSPEHLRKACEASLQRLEADVIDLYQLHRPDPAVPFAESVGALRDLRDEGKIRMVGVSNVDVAQLDEARAIVDVAAVQNQLSLSFTSPLDNGEVAACAEHGIAFLAWSPLGGGDNASTASGAHPAVAHIARQRGVSPQRVALAWLLAVSPTVIPIPGARRPATIEDSVAAAQLTLSPAEMGAIGLPSI
jgi:aryl-alcohol dehydrogenase-like predicted oxidoreductase